MIKNICTLFDKNFLHKGLTLYECLKNKLDTEFTLHCLCIDQETFNVVDSINDQKIIAYNLIDIENSNKDLIKLKESGFKSNYGDAFSQYCWSLTPFFCDLIINQDNVEEVLYVDSDIYFYEGFDLIKKEVKSKSIGIVTHRTSYHLNKETDVGKYNVGIVYFKGDSTGKDCSRFWRNLLLNPANEYSSRYGTCGDQKYLELFEVKFGKENVCIIDDLVGHGAPWCFDSYSYLEKYKIKWLDKEQNLVYNHFAHFNLVGDSWRSSNNGEWAPENIHHYVKEYYEDYHKEILVTKKKYHL